MAKKKDLNRGTFDSVLSPLYQSMKDTLFNSYDLFNKNYLKYTKDRQNEIEDWQSNVSLGVTQISVDSVYSKVYDLITQFYISGADEQSEENASNVKDMLDYFFTVSKSRQELDKIKKDAVIGGTGYIKIGFTNETSDIEYQTPTGKKKLNTITKKFPNISRVSPYNIIIDPAARRLKDARYIAERKIMSSSDFVKAYAIKKPVWTNNDGQQIKIETKDDVEAVARGGVPLSYTDYESLIKTIVETGKIRKKTFREDDQSYKIGNDNIEVVEYWTAEHFKVYINGEEVINTNNPLPLSRLPFEVINFIPVNGSIQGIGIGLLVADTEEIINALHNMELDAKLLTTIPAFEVVRGPQADYNTGAEINLRLKPGKAYEVREANSIRAINLNANNSAAATIQSLKAQLNEVIGINDYTTGASGKVERSAAGVNAKLEAFSDRVKPFLDSIAEAMANVAEMWLYMTIINFQNEEEVLIKIFDDDKQRLKEFKNIKIEDLNGQFDFRFDAEGITAKRRQAYKDFLNNGGLETLGELSDDNGTPIFTGIAKAKLVFEANDLPMDVLNNALELLKEKEVEVNNSPIETQPLTQAEVEIDSGVDFLPEAPIIDSEVGTSPSAPVEGEEDILNLLDSL